jgi:serine/threonine protein kinase
LPNKSVLKTGSPATLSLFLELFPGGSLSSLLGKFGKLPERVAGNYVGQALRGLAYLHGKGAWQWLIK